MTEENQTLIPTVETATEDTTSNDTVEGEQNTTPDEKPEFYWTEEAPGSGSKPEWMKDKYKKKSRFCNFFKERDYSLFEFFCKYVFKSVYANNDIFFLWQFSIHL